MLRGQSSTCGKLQIPKFEGRRPDRDHLGSERIIVRIGNLDGTNQGGYGPPRLLTYLVLLHKCEVTWDLDSAKAY